MQRRRARRVAARPVDEPPPARLEVDGQVDEQPGGPPDDVGARAARRGLGAVRQPHALAVDEQVAHRAHRLARRRCPATTRCRWPAPARPGRRSVATGVVAHGAHRSTSAVTDAGTGVPASTDHGDGSGAPATTRNGTTPDQASVSSSGTEAPPERSLSSHRPGGDRQLHRERRDLLAPVHRPHLGGPPRDQPLRRAARARCVRSASPSGRQLTVDDGRAVVGRRLEGRVRHDEPVDDRDAEHRRRARGHLAQRARHRSSRAAAPGRRRARRASAPPTGGRRRPSTACRRAPRRAGRRAPRARSARARRAGPAARPGQSRRTRPA